MRGVLWKTCLTLVLAVAATAVFAREKTTAQYGAGLIINVPFPENEVQQVVEDVVQNGIIRGTKEYNKDEFVSGAIAANSTRVFPESVDGAKVFYKVRLKAIDPRNFKDGSDVGTLAVRYILQPQGEKNTVLRIDARFAEDFRKVVHSSNGSVESEEYKDIHDRLDAIAVMQEQTAEAEKEKREMASGVQTSASKPLPSSDAAPEVPAGSAPGASSPNFAIAPSDSAPPPQAQVTLQERVHQLRQQVQRLVKAPGAPLKSAPFHTASTLQSLPTGTEVLIVISSPYWVGVETHEGQHGWMLRDDLELVP